MGWTTRKEIRENAFQFPLHVSDSRKIKKNHPSNLFTLLVLSFDFWFYFFPLLLFVFYFDFLIIFLSINFIFSYRKRYHFTFWYLLMDCNIIFEYISIILVFIRHNNVIDLKCITNFLKNISIYAWDFFHL